MGLKSIVISLFAKRVVSKLRKDADRASEKQWETLKHLIQSARDTEFGSDHHFAEIRTYTDFKEKVPIRDYEAIKSYIDKARGGARNVLWPGQPVYFAKTSGTTSGVKYIPLTRESTPHHVNTARNALFAYVAETGNHTFFEGSMLYLSGSPDLQDENGIKIGRLSGIVNHQIPNWIKGNKLPSSKINSIESWEDKVAAMVKESSDRNLTLIGGIPPWVQMYYEELLHYTGKASVLQVFPNLSVFVYGGVNFDPYRAQLNNLMGREIDSIETFPASEGFFAFQDKFPHEGLLLNVNAGMFFEFIPLDQVHDTRPDRLCLDEVEQGVPYALIMSSNAGLWAYDIGDVVEFVSINPYRLRVSGRVAHFISAFGEHVIAKEVDRAIVYASDHLGLDVVEFTVAPQVNPDEGLPYHEWLIELSKPYADPSKIESLIDKSMQEQNIYYRDLRKGKVLSRAKVTLLQPNSFRQYMTSIGKLGGQNKVPRLANDRKIADKLIIKE